MDLNAKIEVLGLKSVALAKAQSELTAELEKVKKHAAKPVPPVRRNLKSKRMQEVENFYTKRQLNKAV